MFTRNVRFQVDITPAHGSTTAREINMYCLTFTQISGQFNPLLFEGVLSHDLSCLRILSRKTDGLGLTLVKSTVIQVSRTH